MRNDAITIFPSSPATQTPTPRSLNFVVVDGRLCVIRVRTSGQLPFRIRSNCTSLQYRSLLFDGSSFDRENPYSRRSTVGRISTEIARIWPNPHVSSDPPTRKGCTRRTPNSMSEMNPTVAMMAAICAKIEIINMYLRHFANRWTNCTAAKTGRNRK